MCLTCIQSQQEHENVPLRQRTVFDPKKALFWNRDNGEPIPLDGVVRGPDNRAYPITDEFRNEMAEKALAIVSEAVDFKVSVWAIQWPNDYVVKHFPKLS